MLRILLIVLQVLMGLSVLLSFVALLATVLMLLKVAVQEFIKEFGLKKTAVVATMALALLLSSVATTHAGETIVQIEDGNLVYYEKTGTVVRDVPKGLTAEQARQLAERGVTSVELADMKNEAIGGLPIIIVERTISFSGGFIEKESRSWDLLVIGELFLLIVMVAMVAGSSGGRIEIGGILLTLSIFAALFTLLSSSPWLTLLAVEIYFWGIVLLHSFFNKRWRRKEGNIPATPR